jgi:hypothetical protein
METSYSGSDITPQATAQDSLAAGPESPVDPDVIAAVEWTKRNPGIGLEHFKPENHRSSTERHIEPCRHCGGIDFHVEPCNGADWPSE